MQRQLVRLAVGVVIWSGLAVTSFAQQLVDRVYRDDTGDHKYQVFVPAGYSPTRPVPAILFLHGAGERGTDGKLPALVGLGPYIKARGASFPFLVVFPQAEDTRGRLLTPWTAGQPDGERALKILDEVQQTFAVDNRRIALVGWSMGGYGAWSLGAAHSEKWSAVVALSGGGDPEKVARLKDTPVWAFHGAGDALVPVDKTRAMVEALKEAGGTVAYNELAETGHDLFRETFGNDGFIAWLLDPKRRPAELSGTSVPLRVDPLPFVPALDMPQSAGVRLGNDVLAALAVAAPRLVPPNMLTGRLNDMFDSTSAQGRSFSVQFSGISYVGALEQARIRAVGPERVQIQLGLRNITLSIAGTSINGGRQAAMAGPINIGIGHNQPVWLAMDVAPYVENRRLRLRLIGANFSIPPESYYVTPPAGVSTRGLGMTQDRVVSGLVSGLYGARSRVENEVRAIAPNIVRQMEDQLTFVDPSPIVAGFWPLPVYQPRLRAYPEAVRTDANGISLVLGMAAASFVPTAAPGGKLPVAPAQVTFDSLSSGSHLQVAFAPQVLSPLSGLLIQSDLARINVLDIPEPSFARLAERAVLTEIIPDLARLPEGTELSSELVLTKPLDVEPGQGATDESAVPLNLQLPGVRVDVAVREPKENWQPYASFHLKLSDDVVAELRKPSHVARLLGIDWGEAATITGTGEFAKGVDPSKSEIDAERFIALFRESWTKWTDRGGNATLVADLKFGDARLRLEDLSGQAGALTAAFALPTIKLTNLSDEDFVYETRSPVSAWGGPYTLSPGKTQEYALPFPMTYRRRGPAGAEEYTLEVGSHSEFRVPKKGGPPRLFEAKVAAD